MSKIYVVNSDMKNVIGMSDPNVMFKGPGPMHTHIYLNTPTHTKAHFFTLAHTRSHSRILAHTRAQPRTLVHTYAQPTYTPMKLYILK